MNFKFTPFSTAEKEFLSAMKKDIVTIVIVTLIIVSFLQVYFTTYTPAVSRDASDQIIIIPDGSSLKSIAATLKSVGIIKSSRMFYVLCRFLKKETLKSGEYNLSACMTPIEILSRIEKGCVVKRKVTIPEGLTIFQIADLLEQKGWVNRDAFLKCCSDSAILSYWNIPGPTIEGYLFPETYYFSKGVSEKQIIDKMIRHFWKLFTPEMSRRVEDLGFSIHEIITLASLIEKETSLPEERFLVSAVFHNRLGEGMQLQSDPTVIYALKDFNGDITRRDLQEVTPYNTYIYKGLPLGPIANPGIESIQAALYPANVPYKYFVSKNNGSHVFSETLQEHNQAVVKYQKRRLDRT